uniref:No apical meristem-associated C-terminal domain-containing protein n=1 Tax=Tanacetum cinerariifolium TaxID=118510 RepID=A0A6L2JCU9_TANCI|nr:hypothetical protein [Tanacetum cinerariifolium]
MSHTNLSQQQTGSSQQPSQEIQEEEDETEPVPIPTSKKHGSLGKRVKTIAKKRVGSDQKNDTFWYKIHDAYNEQAAKKGFTIRTKNMLTGKWTLMNRDVGKFNSLVNETKAMSRVNDENLMTRIEILYRAHEKSYFKHKSAWNFLKGKHKWNNPESTHARRNRNRVTNEEPELFGDDALPRPPGMHRIAKSQRSLNSTASSGSNPAMFQEMMQQQLEIERKEKMERIDREDMTNGSVVVHVAEATSVPSGSVPQVMANAQVNRDRLVGWFEQEVREDFARVREYRAMALGLKVTVRRRRERIRKLKELVNCQSATETVRFWERMQLEDMEKGTRSLLMMKETEVKMREKIGYILSLGEDVFGWDPMSGNCGMAAVADRKFARQINWLREEMEVACEKRMALVEELEDVRGIIAPAKAFEFLRETRLKDEVEMARLQDVERQMDLRAVEKELFVQKLLRTGSGVPEDWASVVPGSTPSDVGSVTGVPGAVGSGVTVVEKWRVQIQTLSVPVGLLYIGGYYMHNIDVVIYMETVNLSEVVTYWSRRSAKPGTIADIVERGLHGFVQTSSLTFKIEA